MLQLAGYRGQAIDTSQMHDNMGGFISNSVTGAVACTPFPLETTRFANVTYNVSTYM